MAKLEISTKRVAISKANAQMVGVTAVAAFVTVFCLVASHSLWGLKTYQSHVTTAKQQALGQLKTDIATENTLVGSYKAFVNSPTNVLEGSSSGTGDNDGDNAKIILDALPSQYDFPALTSSLEKLLISRNFTVSNISGTDDEVAQQANASSATPQAIAMPFSFTVTGANYASVQSLIQTLQQSIRPIQVDTMTLSGGANNLQLTVNAHTYYQPEKDFKVTTKEVK